MNETLCEKSKMNVVVTQEAMRSFRNFDQAWLLGADIIPIPNFYRLVPQNHVANERGQIHGSRVLQLLSRIL
jgi:hypothetical protein